MQGLLKEKLRAYITVNNPDLLLKLQGDYSINQYLEDKISKAMPLILDLLGRDKPGYVIEELVLNELTADLRPSRYVYVQQAVKDGFPDEFEKLKTLGVLQHVTLDILEQCQKVFDDKNFNERNKDDFIIKALVRSKIREYLKG